MEQVQKCVGYVWTDFNADSQSGYYSILCLFLVWTDYICHTEVAIVQIILWLSPNHWYTNDIDVRLPFNRCANPEVHVEPIAYPDHRLYNRSKGDRQLRLRWCVMFLRWSVVVYLPHAWSYQLDLNLYVSIYQQAFIIEGNDLQCRPIPEIPQVTWLYDLFYNKDLATNQQAGCSISIQSNQTG